MQRDFMTPGEIERGSPLVNLIELAANRQAGNGLGSKASRQRAQSRKESPSCHNSNFTSAVQACAIVRSGPCLFV